MLGSTDITQTANTTEPQPQQTPTLTISGGHAPSLDHVIHPERPKAPTYIFDFDRLNESDDCTSYLSSYRYDEAKLLCV